LAGFNLFQVSAETSRLKPVPLLAHPNSLRYIVELP
jgi:hypothetical protein